MNTNTIFAAVVLSSLLAPSTVAAQGFRAPDRSGSHELHMSVEHGRLAVSGGAAFDPCAIMLGLKETSYALPGNAELSVAPLLVLRVGDFDANGELMVDLHPWMDRSGALGAFFVQAITIRQDSEFFATSNVQLLGIMKMTGPRIQPLDGSVDTQPLDDGVEVQSLDRSPRTQPVEGPQTQPIDDDPKKVDTAPLDDSPRIQPIEGPQTQPVG